MKLIGHLLLFCTLLPITGLAQQGLIGDAGIAIEKGSASELGKLLGEEARVTLNSANEAEGATKAEKALRKFFADHPATAFKTIHQGSSSEGLRYAIGKYQSDGNEYRVYLVVKREKGSYVIDKIDFSKQ